KVDRDDVEGVVFLHIERAYVRGFLPVTEESLNGRSSARWQAHVVAKKDGSPDVEFVVTGKDKYFGSATPPVAAPADYFDYAGLVADMTGAATTGNERWRAYAFKGGAMSEASCDADKAYYVDVMSIR